MKQVIIRKIEGGFVMSGGAIFMMIVGILIIWGGLAASIIHAVIKSRANAKALR